jgi:phage terminase large subunit
MWGDMKDWLQTGYINKDIREQLTRIRSTTSSEKFHGKILLESKEKMRKRGVSSPDDADALSFTI